MPFSLSCGDVMPGCAARFHADSRDQLLTEVADHAAADHGVTEAPPELLAHLTEAIRPGPAA